MFLSSLSLFQSVLAFIAALAVIYAGLILVFQNRLSDFTHDSWHLTIAKCWWGGGAYGKTCLYWLVKFPVGLAVYTVLFSIVFVVTGAGLKSFQLGKDDFYLWWISPITLWKLWSGPALIYMVYRLTIVHPDSGLGLLITAAGMTALGACMLLAVGAVLGFLALCNKFCPEMKRPQPSAPAE